MPQWMLRQKKGGIVAQKEGEPSLRSANYCGLKNVNSIQNLFKEVSTDFMDEGAGAEPNDKFGHYKYD